MIAEYGMTGDSKAAERGGGGRSPVTTALIYLSSTCLNSPHYSLFTGFIFKSTKHNNLVHFPYTYIQVVILHSECHTKQHKPVIFSTFQAAGKEPQSCGGLCPPFVIFTGYRKSTFLLPCENWPNTMHNNIMQQTM